MFRVVACPVAGLGGISLYGGLAVYLVADLFQCIPSVKSCWAECYS